ncbi:MFS transporter [Streptomyces sp. NPDC091217]|uniref:MFS transporter n=1 Tax=Streptomyces sp. NPDC091217 TaxID=3365975 RepID=UPI0038174544
MPDVRLPLPALVPFAAGSIGLGVWVTVPGIFLLYFLTDVVAVPPQTAGIALLLPNGAGIVTHPWVGRLSDADLARAGHRRRLMTAGCVVLLAFVALFALFAVPPHLHGTTAALWVAVALIAGNLLYSCYQVSYLATPADSPCSLWTAGMLLNLTVRVLRERVAPRAPRGWSLAVGQGARGREDGPHRRWLLNRPQCSC